MSEFSRIRLQRIVTRVEWHFTDVSALAADKALDSRLRGNDTRIGLRGPSSGTWEVVMLRLSMAFLLVFSATPIVLARDASKVREMSLVWELPTPQDMPQAIVEDALQRPLQVRD